MNLQRTFVLGLLTLITIPVSLFSAEARTPNRYRTTEAEVPFTCPLFSTVACRLPDEEVELTHPIGKGDLGGCAVDPGFSPKACHPDQYKPHHPPQDNGLPPCGIIYNGPCDPKKGI